MGDLDIGLILIWFVVFLLSLTVHECAHALVAEWSGDSTGRYLGRVTLNPVPHIDIFGTIVFPLISLTTSLGGFMFGWAKPVPFNPLNLRDRRSGEIAIAIAGPASNILLLFVFVAAYKLLQSSLVTVEALGDYLQPLATLISIGISMNITLAVFNMIPIPPLDGHHILRNLLPDSLAEIYSQIPPWVGFIILFLLVRAGVTRMLAAPVYGLVQWILS